MAQYNLPQFSTTPTPGYQQQPIVKLPNYAEIYARSFAYGQQATMNAFKPIRAEIEKIQIRKERERLEKKADEERLLRKEENIAKDVSNYQQLIFGNITKEGAGDFEAEIENMLMKNVDGYAANERAYKIEQSISAEDYNKMRAFYFKEINDMKLSSQALKDSLDWDNRNSERYSRYNNAEFPGLIESLKQGEAKLGRTKTGDLAIIYNDALDKEASFLVKDLKNLRAEDNINLKLDFSDKSDIGYQSHDQLETELNQYGVINPTTEVKRQADAINGIATESTVTRFTAEQKEEAIKYVVNQSATMRNLMSQGTGVAGKYYLDNMLYADNMGETGADIKVNALAKKYFQSKNIVPSAEEFEKVENLLETYNDTYLDDPLQNEVKEFQDEQIKLNYAENLWDTRFAIKEKEENVVKVINENITNDDEINSQKIAWADSLPNAIKQSQDIIEKLDIVQEDKNVYPAEYINKITGDLNEFFAINYRGRTLEVLKDEVTINDEGKVNIVYKLPEDIFGKQEKLEISSGMDINRLHGIRNSLYGSWAANIKSDVLITGMNDYRLNKNTPAAEYYSNTISKLGGALTPVEQAVDGAQIAGGTGETPPTSKTNMSNLEIDRLRGNWMINVKTGKFNDYLENNNISKENAINKSTGMVKSSIVNRPDFKETFGDEYPANTYKDGSKLFGTMQSEFYGKDFIKGPGGKFKAKTKSEAIEEAQSMKKENEIKINKTERKNYFKNSAKDLIAYDQLVKNDSNIPNLPIKDFERFIETGELDGKYINIILNNEDKFSKTLINLIDKILPNKI